MCSYAEEAKHTYTQRITMLSLNRSSDNIILEFSDQDLYSIIDVIGSLRHSLTISGGMGPVEQEVIRIIADDGRFGKLKPVVNGKKKHSIECQDESRKTKSYAPDAIFENRSTITILDVKPSEHDNSTSPKNHACKFINARDNLQKTTNKRVRTVLAVYGGKTEEDFLKENYYRVMRANGIICLSMTDEFSFDHSSIREKHLYEVGSRLLEHIRRKRAKDSRMVEIASALQYLFK